MPSETLGIDEWLIATLTGDAALTGLVGARVSVETATAGTAFPQIVIRSLSEVDQLGAGQNRIMSTETRIVEAIVEGESYVPARAIVERIDALLHGQPARGSVIAGTWSGVTVISSHRVRGVRLAEALNGLHFRRLGGVYQITAQ